MRTCYGSKLLFYINKHISQHDDGEEAICSNIAWEFENVGYQGARSVWTITKVIKVPVNSYTFALVNAVKISWNNENNIFNHKKSKQIFKKKGNNNIQPQTPSKYFVQWLTPYFYFDCTLSNASCVIDKSGRPSKYVVFHFHSLLFVSWWNPHQCFGKFTPERSWKTIFSYK